MGACGGVSGEALTGVSGVHAGTMWIIGGQPAGQPNLFTGDRPAGSRRARGAHARSGSLHVHGALMIRGSRNFSGALTRAGSLCALALSLHWFTHSKWRSHPTGSLLGHGALRRHGSLPDDGALCRRGSYRSPVGRHDFKSATPKPVFTRCTVPSLTILSGPISMRLPCEDAWNFEIPASAGRTLRFPQKIHSRHLRTNLLHLL